MDLAQLVGQEWPEPPPGHFAAPTIGLPPRSTVETLRAALTTWAEGRASAPSYDEPVQRARSLYADLVGVPESWVALANQVSVLVGVVAASLPDGADVVVPHGDFTSVIFPFLVHADRGVTVRHVPLSRLADEVRPGTSLVAFSLVQSATGEIADAAAVRAAARAVGALTCCDLTQAAGWLPVDASAYDITVCGGYKWLCNPRGTAYLTVRPDLLPRLRPLYAGWYAGEDRWASIYGPAMNLAPTARRLDVSPAWHSWVGAVPSLEVLTTLPTADVHTHAAGLADALRARLVLAPTGSAIVTIPDPTGAAEAALRAAGCVVSARAGNLRLGLHLWNTPADVDLAATTIETTRTSTT